MSKGKFGQYFNLEAIKSNLQLLKNPKSLTPDLKLKSILNIDPQSLKEKYNINYVIFDKDNTLTKPYENTLPSNDYKNKLEEFRKSFSPINLAIISNSYGSSDDKGYVEALEVQKNIGIQVIRHMYKKPNVFNEIKEIFKRESFDAKEVCIIGDMLLVDVTMGKQLGFFTILLEPIYTDNENSVVKIARKLEEKLI
jgi:phosphatidylglycerophosphatase GEP4